MTVLVVVMVLVVVVVMGLGVPASGCRAVIGASVKSFGFVVVASLVNSPCSFCSASVSLALLVTDALGFCVDEALLGTSKTFPLLAVAVVGTGLGWLIVVAAAAAEAASETALEASSTTAGRVEATPEIALEGAVLTTGDCDWVGADLIVGLNVSIVAIVENGAFPLGFVVVITCTASFFVPVG